MADEAVRVAVVMARLAFFVVVSDPGGRHIQPDMLQLGVGGDHPQGEAGRQKTGEQHRHEERREEAEAASPETHGYPRGSVVDLDMREV